MRPDQVIVWVLPVYGPQTLEKEPHVEAPHPSSVFFSCFSSLSQGRRCSCSQFNPVHPPTLASGSLHLSRPQAAAPSVPHPFLGRMIRRQ